MVDPEADEVLARLRAGLSGIHPRPDALGVVQHQVGRRRRRRRVVGTLAAVAAAAVVVPALVVGGLQLRDEAPVEPAGTPAPTRVLDGTSPVAFFVDLVGGRARGQQTTYRAAPGERYHARFLWWPDADDDAPVHAGAAVERYDGTAAEACARLDPATPCATTADGLVARLVTTTSGDVVLDPVHRRGRFDEAEPGDPVSTATVFRDDGWAVTLTVCACVRRGDDLPDPPLTPERLAEAAADEAWVPDPEG